MKENSLIAQWKAAGKIKPIIYQRIVDRLVQRTNKNIDQLADAVHNDVFKKVDCLDCANCCTSIPAHVTKTDAKRISKYLGLNHKDFERDYLIRDEDEDWVLNSSPCVFLADDNKCEIYDVRPKSCRQYPHTDDLDFSNNAHLHAENAVHCPGVYHILERLNGVRKEGLKKGYEKGK